VDKEQVHVTWKATMVAIATRHADATDIRSPSTTARLDRHANMHGSSRSVAPACHHRLRRSAGRRTLSEDHLANGYDNGREIYTMTWMSARKTSGVVREAATRRNTSLPVNDLDQNPETHSQATWQLDRSSHNLNHHNRGCPIHSRFCDEWDIRA